MNIILPTVGVMVILSILVGLVVGLVSFENSQVETACGVYSKESGRETKFVKYTFFHVDCLTPQKDGWISTFNLRGE